MKLKRKTSEKIYEARRRRLKNKHPDTSSGIEYLTEIFSKHNFILVMSSFSGGIDSLASTMMTLDVIEKLGRPHKIYIVFNNTGNEFPETVKYVRLMFKWFREKYSSLNLSAHEIKPEVNFSKMAQEMFNVAVEMFMSNSIWDKSKLTCCDELKLKPLVKWLRKYRVHFVVRGIRGDESRQRMLGLLASGPTHKSLHIKTFTHTTILDPLWNWSREEVWKYVNSHPLNPPVNPLYEKLSSVGCMLCPVPFLFSHEEIKKAYPPKVYERGMKLLINAIKRCGQTTLDEFRPIRT